MHVFLVIHITIALVRSEVCTGMYLISGGGPIYCSITRLCGCMQNTPGFRLHSPSCETKP